MASTATSRQNVLARIADIIREDFDGKFRPQFALAAKSQGGRPVEAEHEVFNALDHFSRALSGGVTPERAGIKAPASPDARVATHLEWARRHIALAIFYCVEHQIVGTMAKIADYNQRIPSGDISKRKSYQRGIDKIDKKYAKIAAIDVQRLGTLPEIKAELAKLDRTTTQLFGVLAEYMEFVKELATAWPEKPPKR